MVIVIASYLRLTRPIPNLTKFNHRFSQGGSGSHDTKSQQKELLKVGILGATELMTNMINKHDVYLRAV